MSLGSPINSPIKVSAAMAFNPKASVNPNARRIAHIIDQIHTDGSLPTTEVRDMIGNELRSRALGFLDTDHNVIAVRASGSHFIETTFIHEVGHLVDVLGFGSNCSAAANHGDFKSWREAVGRSTPIRHLNRINIGKTILIPTASGMVPFMPTKDDYKFVRYLLKVAEIWARSYEQFIVTLANDMPLSIQFNFKRNYINGFPMYWSNVEFRQLILPEMIKIFKNKGWM